LFLRWAAEANNPVVAEQLRQRAQQCSIAADALDARSSGPPPTEQTTPVMQQQQIQHKKKEDE
jgi:hypothetical protein